MKMSPETLSVLQSAIVQFLDKRGLTTDSVLSEYRKAGLSDMRARWDTLYAALSTKKRNDLFGRMYDEGLKDPHIDTALRKIFSR